MGAYQVIFMNENKDILLKIELVQLTEIESLLEEEIVLQNELAKTESSHLAKIASLLDEEKKQKIKQNCYQDVCKYCETERFPCAIALVESLARHLPDDLEVRQWQASIYQRLGRKLVEDNQIEKARVYLKKALKTDPHNRSLWSEVERDFRQLEIIVTSFVA